MVLHRHLWSLYWFLVKFLSTSMKAIVDLVSFRGLSHAAHFYVWCRINLILSTIKIQFKMCHLKHHVRHHLAVWIANAVSLIITLCAVVCLIWLVRHQIVIQNVWLAQNVHSINLASTRNVEIHVKVFVGSTQDAKLWITIQFVAAN